MRAMMSVVTGLALGLVAAPAWGETEVTQETQTGIAVTIYNQDLALIRDSRRLVLRAGENDIAFIDVSAFIRPETALLASPDGGLAVIEQNFDFDLLTPQKLLEKSVGQEIRIFRTNPDTGADTQETALVLSVVDGQAVLKIGDRIETAIPGRLVYSAVPPNLRARPTLTMKISSSEGGVVPVDLSYLTRGLSWAADYVADLSPDEKSIALNGWVTLGNTSGIAYRDAKLQLVAGAVNQVQPAMEQAVKMDMAQAGAMAPMMSVEAAFEYHLYSLDRPTTIADNQTKQVALLAAADIPVEKQYLLTNVADLTSGYARNFGEAPRRNAIVRLKFVNTEKAHLGIALPAGIMRVYKKDGAGNTLFVGEDRIEHTPKNERVALTLGQAFDITARVKQTDFERLSDRLFENAYEIEIKNAKSQPVTVDLREAVPGDWKILSESSPHEKLDSATAGWTVKVPAEGSALLTYRVRIEF